MKMKFWMGNDHVFFDKIMNTLKKYNYALCFHFYNLLGKKRKIFPSKSQELR